MKRLLTLSLALLAAPAAAQGYDLLAGASYDPLAGVTVAAAQPVAMVTITERVPVYATFKVCHGSYCTLERRLTGYRTQMRQVPAGSLPAASPATPPAPPRPSAARATAGRRGCGCVPHSAAENCPPNGGCLSNAAKGACNCHGERGRR